MAYTLYVMKRWPKDPSSGLLVTHSKTALDIPLADAKEAARAMRDAMPPGFLVELQGPDNRAIPLHCEAR